MEKISENLALKTPMIDMKNAEKKYIRRHFLHYNEGRTAVLEYDPNSILFMKIFWKSISI